MSTTIFPARLSPRSAITVGDGGVGNGEDDDVAGDRGGGVGLAQQLDGVAAPACDGRDGLAHVAGTDDGEVRHDVCSLIGCCFN